MASSRTYDALAAYLAASAVGDAIPMPLRDASARRDQFSASIPVDIRTDQGRCRDRSTLGAMVTRARAADDRDAHDLFRAGRGFPRQGPRSECRAVGAAANAAIFAALTARQPAVAGGLMNIVVDFHFDPMCPFAYQTSLWIRDVREQLGITVNWRFFSLEEINRVEGKKHPWERDWSYGWSLMRIGATAATNRHGAAGPVVRRDRTRTARRGGKPHDPAVARRLLSEIGVERRSSMRRWTIRPPTTTFAPSISGSSTRADTECRRCFCSGSACLGRYWWTRRPDRPR